MVAALNAGIILHRLTLSLHITLKAWRGNVDRQTEEESGAGVGRLKGRYNDHTLLSHTRARPFSQRHHALRPTPLSPSFSLGP